MSTKPVLVIDGNVVGEVSSPVSQSDLTSISIKGNTNNTGSKISKWTFFYKDDVLVKAIADIANGAILTLNTNYEVVTAGALNSIPEVLFRTRIVNLTIDGTTDDYGNVSVDYVSPLPRAYVLSNISNDVNFAYNITVNDVRDTYIRFRVRNMADNSAVKNTAINTNVCVIFK